MVGRLQTEFIQSEAGMVPRDWEVKRIGEFLKFYSGKAHEQYVSPAGRFVIVNSKFISTDGKIRKHSTKSFLSARVGDVLMVMSDLPNGRALAKCYLVDRNDFYAVNQRVCIFRSRNDDPRYLRFVLNRNPYFMAFDDGVQQTHLLNDPIKKCPVILPPVAEQRAIADAVTDAEHHIAMLERLIAKKQLIKQGMMQQLLNGRTRLPGFTGGWESRTLGEVTVVDPESISSSTAPNSTINYISLEQVSRGAIFGSTEVAFGDAPSRARRIIREGDFLFGTVRPNLQSHALYSGGIRRPIASTGFAVVRSLPGKIDPQYLTELLLSDITSKQIERIIAGSNYPAVSSNDVRELRFDMPGIDEQAAIGRLLGDMTVEVETIRRRLSKSRAIKQGMMQELLTGRTRLQPAEALA